MFGRYLDVDGDGIGYRTLPGTHPSKGAFFTRGTSRDEFAAYTESPEAYSSNMERLLEKWKTPQSWCPRPKSRQAQAGVLYYGTTALPMREALDVLGDDGISLDTCRIRAFPFGPEVSIRERHDLVFRRRAEPRRADAQPADQRGRLRSQELVSCTLLRGLFDLAELSSIAAISDYYQANKLPRLTEVTS